MIKMASKKQKTGDLRKMTVTAIMSALGFVLMFLGDSIEIPFMPSFIKLDFSELPALITAFAFGPLWGVGVCALKNIIHLLFFFGHSAGIGELANFLLGFPFVAVAGLVYKKHHDRKHALIGALSGDFVMAAATFVVNLFLIYPLYINIMHFPLEAIMAEYQKVMPSMDSMWKAILAFNVPFTFIKGLFSVIITFVIYHNLSPILKGRKIN